MKLRGLLKLITGLVVIVPTSLSVVACGTSAVTKNDLKTITELLGVNFILDTTKKYSVFDSVIANATEFSAKPMKDFTVKYYDAVTGGNDITDKNQTGDGKVYIVITASATDTNWTGSTSDTARIVINVVGKFNLDSVTTIADLSSGKYFNPKVTYSALDSIIKNANEFKTNTLTSYSVKYYDAVTGGNDITANNQSEGTVYVVITADSSDLSWTGSTSDTNRLYFTLNKVNLSTITTLSGLNITVNTTQTYSQLNANIASATEFSTNPLATGYSVKYYDAVTGGNDITANNQSEGTVYVVITADSNDSYWTGSTSDTARIAITINKVNLSTITTLSGLNITVNTTQTYSQLNANIASATEFSTNPLATGYSVKYYDAVTGGNDITANNQSGGTVYVVITAGSNDSYWTGSTSDTKRIVITINKVNLSTITTLSGLNITGDRSQTFSKLNAKVASATEFSANPLAAGYSVAWYSTNGPGASDLANTLQYLGTVYVVITAGSSDSYWTGSNTTKIAVIVK